MNFQFDLLEYYSLMVEQPTTYFSEHALSLPPPEQQQQLVQRNFQISNFHDSCENFPDFFSQVIFYELQNKSELETQEVFLTVLGKGLIDSSRLS